MHGHSQLEIDNMTLNEFNDFLKASDNYEKMKSKNDFIQQTGAARIGFNADAKEYANFIKQVEKS